MHASRRRMLLAVGAIVAVLLVFVTLEVVLTEPATLIPAGRHYANGFAVRDATVGMNIGSPGIVTGSWSVTPYIIGPNFTTEVYHYSACTPASPSGAFPAQCSGTPVWSGKGNTGADSIDAAFSPGFYFFVWVSANDSMAVDITVDSPVSLMPSQWWWL